MKISIVDETENAAVSAKPAKTLNVVMSRHCGHECSFCCNKDVLKKIADGERERGETLNDNIPLDVLSWVVDNHNIDKVKFVGIGETLAVENFVEAYEYCATNDKIKNVEIFTGGCGTQSWWLSFVNRIYEHKKPTTILFNANVEKEKHLDKINFLCKNIDRTNTGGIINVKSVVVVNTDNISKFINRYNDPLYKDLMQRAMLSMDKNCLDKRALVKVALVGAGITKTDIAWRHEYYNGDGICSSDFNSYLLVAQYDNNEKFDFVEYDENGKQINGIIINREGENKMTEQELKTYNESRGTIMNNKPCEPQVENKAIAPRKLRVRVCVCYPHNGIMLPQVSAALDKLKSADFAEFDVYEVQGANIGHMRSRIAAEPIGNNALYQKDFGYDYLLNIDSDIVFDVADVKKLIERDLPIVSGAYQYRRDINYAVAGTMSAIRNTETSVENKMVAWDDGGLLNVEWVGAGFLLVKAEVFEKIAYPYFKEGEVVYHVDGVARAALHGEDVGFCILAKRAGYDVYVDMSCKVEHILCPEDVEGAEKGVSFKRECEQRNTMQNKILRMYNETYNAIKKIDERITKDIDDVKTLRGALFAYDGLLNVMSVQNQTENKTEIETETENREG